MREVSLLGVVQAIDFLADGDLLRPCEEQPLVSVASDVALTVLAPTRLALLDQDFLRTIQPWPALVAELLRRQERRADWLAHVLAISHLPRVETRVLVLFWLFADRWGRRRGDEVVVPIPLTHVNIARLVGAQRPTVTAVLQRLVGAGKLEPRSSGQWILRGEPPSSTRLAPTSEPDPGR